MDAKTNPVSQETKKPIQQKNWMTRARIKFFTRPDLSMRIKKVVHIASPVCMKVLAGSWEQLSRDVYYVSTDARRILSSGLSSKVYQEDEIFKAETAIYAELTRINDYFDRRIAQAEQKLSAAGCNLDSVPQNCTSYEAESTTNVSTEYLQIIKKADIYMCCNEFLWVMGELSDRPDEAMRAKLNNEREARGHLFAIGRTSTRHFEVVRRICTEVRRQQVEEQMAYSAKQAARDKQASNKEAKAKKHSDQAKQSKQAKQAGPQQKEAKAPKADRADKKGKALASAQKEMNKLAAPAPVPVPVPATTPA